MADEPDEVLTLPDTDEVQTQIKEGGASVTFFDVAQAIVARLEELFATDKVGLGVDVRDSIRKELRFVSDCLSVGHENSQLSCAMFAATAIAGPITRVLSTASTVSTKQARMETRAQSAQNLQNIYSSRASRRSVAAVAKPKGKGSLESAKSIKPVADKEPEPFVEPRPNYYLRGTMHHIQNHGGCGAGADLPQELTKNGLPWMGESVPQWPRPHVTGADESGMSRMIVESFNNWDFDIFEFTRLSAGKVLQFTGWEALRRSGCFTEFHVDPAKASKFLQRAASTYASEPTAPYHNSIHAADVTQTVHALRTEIGLSSLFNPLDNLGTVIAAIVHDMGHDGRNNAFHTAVMSHVALTYNDRSVQENFSVAEASKILQHPDADMLHSLRSEQLRMFRRELIDMVLSTDMALHFKKVGNFKDMAEKLGQDWMAWQAQDEQMDSARAMILHLSDISNQGKQFKLSHQWSHRALSEFFAQGDHEKSLGIPVSPMCDRAVVSVAGSQVGFIQFIVQPSFVALSRMLQKVEEVCLVEVASNKKSWEERQRLDVENKVVHGHVAVQYIKNEAEEILGELDAANGFDPAIRHLVSV